MSGRGKGSGREEETAKDFYYEERYLCPSGIELLAITFPSRPVPQAFSRLR
jgi:hypothetical protein